MTPEGESFTTGKVQLEKLLLIGDCFSAFIYKKQKQVPGCTVTLHSNEPMLWIRIRIDSALLDPDPVPY
jgi:hypothetical protein